MSDVEFAGARPKELSDLGAPPPSLEDNLGLETEGKDIYFCCSSKISQDDPLYISYWKAARARAADLFPECIWHMKTYDTETFEKIFAFSRSKMIEVRSALQHKIKALLEEGVRIKASDIHFDTWNNDRGIIRMRVYGELILTDEMPSAYLASLISVVYNTMCKIAQNMYMPNIAQNAMFREDILPRELSGVRVACTPSLNGPAMVLRLLYNENIELDSNKDALEQLGYSAAHIQVFSDLIRQPSGIIFIAGPTNSGKTTTLKYILKAIADNPKLNVISMEDPPEYPIPQVRQIPINTSSNDSERHSEFRKTDASILRQDPNRIMVGEIRDGASASAAIRCAQTGHQVWTTIHSNNAFAIVARMADLLMEKMPEGAAYRLLLDPTILNGLMFQRLVPVLCPDCRVSLEKVWSTLPEQLRDRLVAAYSEKFQILDNRMRPDTAAIARKTIEALQANVFIRSAVQSGCVNPKCHNGIVGRRVVAEVVYTTPSILDAIGNYGPVKARRLWLAKNPEASLQAHARTLVMSGIVDPNDAELAVGPLTVDIEDRKILDQQPMDNVA